ncbi:universal stress protein [Bradyrhizobium sp. BRP22]|uniref:universal stress protein n=1 Tax=Bradyrhizobium sp. BRP22 TaxID=2793821 RepID=UPI001CD35F1D|nr:universal stress protein [Bradyrhizobium sp. BRP22]MCA1456062.1 universal stress protein [Bradyrhizobium sp. BRP22]
MSLANVMVYVDPQQQEEGQIRVAEGIATKFGASIIGVSAFAVEPPFAAEGVMIEETTEEDLKRMQAGLAAKEDWFRSVVGLPGDKVEWRWAYEFPTTFLVDQARAADLVVIKRKQLKENYYHYIDAAEAMLRMGRPMLSVPERVTELSADRVVVGWKDTREARLAVRDALPFLTRASRVTVIELCTSDQQDAARLRVRDVAKYLGRHGASCQYEVRVHTAEPDARYLIRLARDEGADLIVTGGYGHSRLGEWIFGGMTIGLLREAPICLMMSH